MTVQELMTKNMLNQTKLNATFIAAMVYPSKFYVGEKAPIDSARFSEQDRYIKSVYLYLKNPHTNLLD